MITLTETAAKKIEDLRLEEGKPEWGLRIRVVGGGCSGMSYELGWDDAAGDDDNVVESYGVRVLVDPGLHPGPQAVGDHGVALMRARPAAGWRRAGRLSGPLPPPRPR